MGKLLDRLNKQLKTNDFKKDAKECIIVYNAMLLVTGKVSSLTWAQLTDVKFEGFPSSERYYFLSPIGKIFLRGINSID